MENKRILYYSLTLPGGGKRKPPLPVSEMLTTDHTIVSIERWLRKFMFDISTCTTKRVQHVETDYSWALIHSVLFAFNGDTIHAYLNRAMKVCQGKLKYTELQMFTVLHLCSAHVIKAVSQAISKKTTDKGLRDFATFSFAILQNSTTLSVARNVFKHMCIVLSSRRFTNEVQSSVCLLNAYISQTTTPDQMEKEAEVKDTDEVLYPKMRGSLGRSPFAVEFKGIYEDSISAQGHDDYGTQHNVNPYFCEDIIRFLLQRYMALFPLWSGILLGDLARYASDSKKDISMSEVAQTRATNCHVETWFGIVKHSILQHRRKLRPAEFITIMRQSLQGRYREHIIQNALPKKVLTAPLITTKTRHEHAQEQWAKRAPGVGKETKNKFYSAPQKIPIPKKMRTQEKKVSNRNIETNEKSPDDSNGLQVQQGKAGTTEYKEWQHKEERKVSPKQAAVGMAEVITPHCDARPISKLIKEKTDFKKKVGFVFQIFLCVDIHFFFRAYECHLLLL